MNLGVVASTKLMLRKWQFIVDMEILGKEMYEEMDILRISVDQADYEKYSKLKLYTHFTWDELQVIAGWQANCYWCERYHMPWLNVSYKSCPDCPLTKWNCLIPNSPFDVWWQEKSIQGAKQILATIRAHYDKLVKRYGEH